MQIWYNFEPLIDKDGTEKVSFMLKKKTTNQPQLRIFSEAGEQTQILALKVTNKIAVI